MNSVSAHRSTCCSGWALAAATASMALVLASPAAADAPAQINCTGADYAAVTAGVAASMSTYLFNHPDVNDYVTELESAPRGQSAQDLVDYEVAHPTVREELATIRQPIIDFDVRCGYGQKSDSV